jgi:type IV pilus assembly protein PilB
VGSSPSSSGRRRRLGELLVEATLITEDQLRVALLEQRKWGGRLGRTLVEMGVVTESAMVGVLAGQLQLKTVDLDTVKLPPRVTDLLRLDLAERYGVFPLGLDGSVLHLATSDPTNLEQLQELSFACAKRVQVAVATASSIDRAVRKYYFGEQVTPMETIHPRNLGVEIYELDGSQPPPPAPAAPLPPMLGLPTPLPQLPPVVPPSAPLQVTQLPAPPAVTPQPVRTDVAELRLELAVLKEQVQALEGISASQVRALRALMEILIESGLVGRDEYLERLQGKSE